MSFPVFPSTERDRRKNTGATRVVGRTAQMALACLAANRELFLCGWRVGATLAMTGVRARTKPITIHRLRRTRCPQDQSRGGSRALQSILVGMTSLRSGVFNVQAIGSRGVNMNQHVALDSALATSLPQRKGDGRLLALCSFILGAAVLAIAALISDSSFTPEQRIQVFQQSGVYP
jgi:hypothetical protein